MKGLESRSGSGLFLRFFFSDEKMWGREIIGEVRIFAAMVFKRHVATSSAIISRVLTKDVYICNRINYRCSRRMKHVIGTYQRR
jgi:hypothetical protein